jgi:hypothetical protein
MNTVWPDTHIKKTMEVLESLPLSFFAHELSCLLKNLDGRLGRISLEHAFQNRWLIQVEETREKEEFETLEKLIEGGWILHS